MSDRRVPATRTDDHNGKRARDVAVRELGPVFRLHAELCRALSNEHRLAVLHAVCQEEMCTGELATKLELPAATVSQHLRVLRRHNVVRTRKEAQTVYAVVADPRFAQACALLRQAIVEQFRVERESLRTAEGLIEMRGRSAPTEGDEVGPEGRA